MWSTHVRFHSRIQGVKEAVADLRTSVKNAIAFREKCSLTLSAAMGATLALEQVGSSVVVLVLRGLLEQGGQGKVLQRVSSFA